MISRSFKATSLFYYCLCRRFSVGPLFLHCSHHFFFSFFSCDEPIHYGKAFMNELFGDYCCHYFKDVSLNDHYKPYISCLLLRSEICRSSAVGDSVFRFLSNLALWLLKVSPDFQDTSTGKSTERKNRESQWNVHSTT